MTRKHVSIMFHLDFDHRMNALDKQQKSQVECSKSNRLPFLYFLLIYVVILLSFISFLEVFVLKIFIIHLLKFLSSIHF